MIMDNITTIPNVKDNQYVNFDLLAAASLGDLGLVHRLLKSSVNIEETNESGWTSLMYAAHYGHYNVIKMLIDNGANVNTQEWIQGRTALMLASSCGHTKCIETLITLGGADIDIKDYNNHTASYYAIHSGHGRNKIISKLLKIQPKCRVISRPITKLKNGDNPSIILTKPEEENSLNIKASPEFNNSSFSSYRYFPKINENIDSNGIKTSFSTPIPTNGSAQDFTPHYHLDISKGNKRRFNLYNNCENSSEIRHKSLKSSEESIQDKSPLPKNLDQLLSRLDLSQYRDIFVKNGIDLYCFLTLSENDFENIGIYAIGHRRKLSLAQARFRESIEISNIHERFFADWLLYERENLRKENQELKLKIKQLEALCDTVGTQINEA